VTLGVAQEVNVKGNVVGMGESVGLVLLLRVPEPLLQLVGERESVGDKEVEMVVEPQLDRLPEGEPLALGEELTDTLGVGVADKHWELLPERVPPRKLRVTPPGARLAEAVRERETVGGGVRVGGGLVVPLRWVECEREGVALVVRETVGVEDSVVPLKGEALGLMLPELEALGEALVERLTLCVGESLDRGLEDWAGEPEGVRETLPLRVATKEEAAGEVLTVRVRFGEALEVRQPEAVTLRVRVRDRVTESVTVLELELDAQEEDVRVPPPWEAVAAAPVALRQRVGLLVKLPSNPAFSLGLGLSVKLEVGVKVGEGVPPVAVGVAAAAGGEML